MSDDDGLYDDEDDYIYFDSGPYADADDLAEHTMPSPVWLNNDQGLEFYDVLDALLLDGDDGYFDQPRPAKRKREAGHFGDHTSGNADVPRNRQKQPSTDGIFRDPAPRGIVVWRTQDHDALPLPIFRDGIQAGVALLKDWRERFNHSAVKTTYGVKRRSIKTASAVVVERRQPTEASRGCVASTANTTTNQFPKRKVAKPSKNDHAGTAAPRKMSNNKHVPATDTHRPALAQRGNTTKATSLKRKATNAEDEEDELQADHGDFAIPKTRVIARIKGPIHPSASGVEKPNIRATDSQPVVPNLRTKRNATRPNTASTTGANFVDKAQTRAANTRSTKRKK